MHRTFRLASALMVCALAGDAHAEDADLQELQELLIVPVAASDGCPIQRADTLLGELRTLCWNLASAAKTAKKRDRAALENFSGVQTVIQSWRDQRSAA